MIHPNDTNKYSYYRRCRQYEDEKRKLRGLSPQEYEAAVRKLAEKYGV